MKCLKTILALGILALASAALVGCMADDVQADEKSDGPHEVVVELAAYNGGEDLNKSTLITVLTGEIVTIDVSQMPNVSGQKPMSWGENQDDGVLTSDGWKISIPNTIPDHVLVKVDYHSISTTVTLMYNEQLIYGRTVPGGELTEEDLNSFSGEEVKKVSLDSAYLYGFADDKITILWDGTKLSFPDGVESYPVTGEVILNAIINPIYEVTLQVGDVTTDVLKTGRDGTVELPTPVREHFDFDGWALDGKIIETKDGRFSPTSDVTLTAVFSPGKVTVTFVMDGKSTQSAVLYGNQIVAPELPDGHVWTKDGAAFDFSTPVTEDMTLVCEPVTLFVYFKAGDTTVKVEVPYGSTVEPIELPAGFEKWDYDFTKPITVDTEIKAVIAMTPIEPPVGPDTPVKPDEPVTPPVNPDEPGTASEGGSNGISTGTVALLVVVAFGCIVGVIAGIFVLKTRKE